VDNILNNTWAVLDKKEKKQFSFLLVAGIIISIADILALVILLWIVNFYIQPGSSNSLSFLPGWLSNHDSIGLIAVFGVLFALKNIAGFLVAKAQYTFTGRVAVRVSLNSLVNYQQSSFIDFINTDSSALIRKIAIQPFEFSQHVLSGVQQIITQLFLVLISILAILLFNAKLFLLLLAILLPPVIIVFFFIRKRLVRTRQRLRDSNERSYQYLLDALKGYVEANIYQRNNFFLRRFLEDRRRFSASLFDSLALQNLPARVIEIFAVTGLFILILIAKWNNTADRNFLVTIGAFMAAAYKIIPGMVKLINYWGQIKAYEFSPAEMARPSDPRNLPGDMSPAILRSAAFNHVSFRYAGKLILHDISFSLREGELLGIRGDSGIGKTTLLNILLGFITPSSG
jgi:ABC-type multidrug transport system fused ATPase/permease subunit